MENNKLYNRKENNHLKRVRSVVRISRRSSEPYKRFSVKYNPLINEIHHDHHHLQDNKTLESQSKPLSGLSSSPLPESNGKIDWEGFKDYLINLNQTKHCIQNKIGYAKRYCHILESQNAQDLLKASNGCRVHTMRSLSSLSKFLGCYDDWMAIVKKYQLRWKNGDYNSLNTFKSIFGIEGSNEQSLSDMVKWIKTTIDEMPKEHGNILLFNTLTGLRPAEDL